MQDRPPGTFIHFVHLLRGIAPLLVVWPHLSGLWLYTHEQQWYPWTLFVQVIEHPLHLLDGGGRLGVVLFFLISGFIISHTARGQSRREFLVRRLMRLLPPLAAATALMAVVTTISLWLGYGPIIGNTAQSVYDYVVSAVLLNYPIERKPLALAVAWSLYAEIIFYGIVAVLIPLIQRSPVRSTVVMMAICVALVLPIQVSELLSFHAHFTVYLPLFVIGRIFYLERTGALTPQQTWVMIGANVALLLVAYGNKWPDETQGLLGLPVADVVIGILMFYGAMNLTLHRLPRPVAFCADISYSLYLVHLPVGMLILNAAHAHGLPFGLGWAIAVPATFVVATLSYHLIELPAQKMARSMLKMPLFLPRAPKDA